jgi:hypothetical protein
MSLTKNDLQQIENIVEKKLDQKLDQKFDEKLKPIDASLKRIEKKLDTTIRTFDRDINYHHRCLVQLEEKVGVKTPSFSPPIN